MLKRAELVQDTSVAPFVLYRLSRDTGVLGRLMRTILDTVATESDFRRERDLALERSRSRGKKLPKR